MEAIPKDLIGAALGARDRLGGLSRSAAAANVLGAKAAPQSELAGAAREAIFVDALLAAMHARFEELKNVAK